MINVEKWRSPIHFLEIASLDFANFAYCNRQDLYITDLGGCSLQKIFSLLWVMKEACFQIIFITKFTISTFIRKFSIFLHNMIDNNDF